MNEQYRRGSGQQRGQAFYRIGDLPRLKRDQQQIALGQSELLAHPELTEAICNEVAAVMEREGHHTSADDLLYYVNQVIDNTAENISSMLQDVRAQRRTEADYITGYLLRRARAHGIAVPENTRLYEQIKRKESEYERIGTDMPRPW